MSTAVAIFLQLIWSYQKFESGLGTRVAEIAIIYHSLLLLGMMVVGVGLGHWIDQMIRQKKSIFRTPKKRGVGRIFHKVMGTRINRWE
jgi:hypothetical protein